MNNVTQYIFPGAIIGSLILASFGYSVMASAPGITIPNAADHTIEQIDGDQQNRENTEPSTADQGNESECHISKDYPKKIRQWCDMITKHSIRNKLDPDLIAALIWQESGGNPDAYSKSGAVGLMQIMPRDGIAKTFMCPNGPCFINRPSIEELKKPNFNVKYGTNFLAGLVNKYGDTREALKFYGPMDVGYYYADKVLGIYQNYSQQN